MRSSRCSPTTMIARSRHHGRRHVANPRRSLSAPTGPSLWPVADLGLAVLVDEGRRAMKDRQTPTLHARDLLRTRAAVERFWLLMVGRVPSCEALGAGVEVVREPGARRAWPLVEDCGPHRGPAGQQVCSGSGPERRCGASPLPGGRRSSSLTGRIRPGDALRAVPVGPPV